MDCPNCHQPVEAGAAYCGNCGQALATGTLQNSLLDTQVAALGSVSVAAAIPAYALTTPAQHAGEVKALLAVVFGAIGIVGSLFVALLGIVLGTAGIVLGTMSHNSQRKAMSLAGIIISSLAVLASLASWAYVISHDKQLHAQSSHRPLTSPSSAVAAADVATPCYATGFIDKLYVNNTAKSCDMAAFNGQSLNTSTNVYKIYANKSPGISQANFSRMAKLALEKDVQTNLAGFTIEGQAAGQFAGSPAYSVLALDKTRGFAVIEAAVYHPVTSGENIFVLVHAVNGKQVDLGTLEAQWRWQ